MNALQSQVQQQLKKQFAFLDDPNISGTPTQKQVNNMEKAYGNPKTQRLSAKEREANLEAFNANLTENARQTGQAFMQNTAGRPIEERYEMQKEAQNAFKAQLSHLSEEQQQLALDTFNAETDVLKQADNEAGVIARTGDLLSYIPSTATKFGEQLTGLFSPDGDWRKWFTDATKEVESWRSDESKLRNYINAQNLAQAKANGESGFTQYLANAVNAPLETIGQFAESAIPTIASGVIGAAAAPVTGGASLALPFAIGGVQGAGETRNNIYDHIMAMPETQLAQSPEYQALLTQGLSPAQARNELASSLTEHGGEILATGVSSAVLNKLGGLGRIGQAGKGVLGSTTGKFVSEALTEPADEVFQQLMGNKAIHDIDPTHSLSDGLGEAAAGGLLFGVAGGGLAAADNAFRTENTAEKAEAPAVNPESPKQADQDRTQAQQTATPINSQALDEALKPYQDSEEYAEMRADLERDIEDGVIEERAKSNSQYGKLAQAYLAATGQATAEPQAVENPQNVATQDQAEAELQQTANTAPTAPRNVLTGSQDSVDVGENDYQPFQYEVMEADDLAPTQQKAGNQLRDRERTASQAQVNKIARNLDPRKVADSPTMDFGAPLLAQDGKTVIAGNGRSMAIRQAYAEGNADNYRQYLQQNAAKFGVDGEQLAAMKNPVLVRRLNTAVDIKQTAINSNEQGGMRMSNLEQAKVDAQRLPNMAGFELDESGNLNTPNNRSFISQFIQNQPENLRNELLDKEGKLSQTGVQRLRNAMLFQAYGDTDTLARAVESTDQGARNIINALTRIAPKVAQVKQDIANDDVNDVDISSDIVQAVEKYNQLKNQNQDVGEYLQQQDFVSELSPEAKSVLRIFDENSRSSKRISDILTSYYQTAETQGNAVQSSMFGEEEFDKAGTLEQAKNAELEDNPRFSLNESSDSPFAKAVDSVMNGRVRGKFVQMGTTPDVLKMLGLPDTTISIRDSVIEKAVAQRLDSTVEQYEHPHNLTAEDLKKLPAQINNPIAVMKSASTSTNPNGFVVLTELFEQEGEMQKPVIAALSLRQTAKGLEVINISSVHGRPVSQIKNFLMGDLLYWNKAKGYPFADSVGLQLPRRFSADNLSARNVKTETDLSQYQNPQSEQNTNVESNDTEQTHARELLRRALGQHADKIELVRDEQFGENDARRGAEGWYHNGKLYLNLDGITDGNILSKDERLVWVAWHELGHHGVEVQLSQALKNQLRQARKNVVVNGIANRIFVERRTEAKRENNPNLEISQEVATEEAIVELFAAMETGNWAEIESRYNVKIKDSWRSPQGDLAKRLSYLANFFKRLVARITGKNLDTVSNQEVLDLLATVKQGIAKSTENSTASEARYSFAGENARNADHTSLEKAKADVANGKDSETVRKETGWFKGIDGKWRFELDSSQARFNMRGFTFESGVRHFDGRLADILNYPQLFEAYPDLAEVRTQIFVDPKRNNNQIGGAYQKNHQEAIDITANALIGRTSAKSSLLHEIQHAIQAREDFAQGGNPKQFNDINLTQRELLQQRERLSRLLEANPQEKAIYEQRQALAKTFDGNDLSVSQKLGELSERLDETEAGMAINDLDLDIRSNESKLEEGNTDVLDGYEQYRRLAGETESRNVQSRMNMTAEERRNTSPESTEDVPRYQQTVRFDNDRAAFALREDADSDFAKAVDAIAEGENPTSPRITLGTTPDVLKMLGIDDANVVMNVRTLRKDMVKKHRVSPEAMKQLPQQMNNPIAVVQSRPDSTNPEAYLMLTELKEVENGKELPVIAALDFAKNDNGDLELVEISSAYGRKNVKVAKDLLYKPYYWNKTKGNQFLENFSLSSENNDLLSELRTSFSSDDYLSANDIKTETDLSQYQAENSEVRFSRSENLTRADYDQAKANGETELDFNQWKQVRSPEFKRWFGDWENDPDNASKVVNPRTGEPLVVYHGTDAQFTAFQKNKQQNHRNQYGGGFFFTENSDTADLFGGNKMAVYLNARTGLKEKVLARRRGKELELDYMQPNDNRGIWIVYEPNQIKSATDNNGDFSSENDDIRFSRAQARPKSESLEKLRQSKTIRISGTEIEPSEDLRQYKRNALAYGKNLRGAYVNKDTGREIELGAGGVKEVLQHDYKNPDHLQSIAAIPQIIENAIYIDTLPNEETNKNFAIDEYEYYLAGLNIGGTDYTVKAVVGVSKDGDRYYDHKLTEIEKNELLSLPSRITNPVGESSSLKGDLLEMTSRLSSAEISNQSPLSDFNDKRLLQILQDKQDENSDPLFSRKQTSMEILTDGKVKHETLWGTVKAGEFGKIWNEVQRKTDFALTDETRPVLDWIGDLDLAQVQANELKSDFELADGVRHSLNSQLMQRFLKPLHKNIVRLAKKRKKDIEWTKKALGIWVSANYSIQKNQELLARDEQAMREAKQAFDEAKANGTNAEIDKAERAYIRAERQYRYRKHDVELNNWEVDEKGKFIVPRKVGVAGFSIPHAKALMAAVEKHFSVKEVQEATEPLRKAVEWNIRKNFEHNRITEEQFKAYMRNLDYVPLTGDPDSLLKDDDDFIGGASSKGVNTSRDKNMKGRVNSEAEDAIDAVYRMLDKTVANAAWQPFKNGIDTVYEQKLAEAKAQGMTEEQAKEHVADTVGIRRQVMQGTTRTNDEVLIRKFGNVYYEYRLPEEVIKAIKGGQRNVDEFKVWQHKLSPMRYVRKLTGLYAQGVTQFKLPFAPKNMIRDIWEKSALITTRDIYDTNGKPLSQKAKNRIGSRTFSALANPAEMARVLRATGRLAKGDTENLDVNNEHQRDLKELIELGGVSNYSTYLARTDKDLVEEIKKLDKPHHRALEGAKYLTTLWNGTFDYASSLAAYRALKEAGVDKKQAADITLNLTNFRKQGWAAKHFKPLYMFLNPTLQGGKNLVQMMKTRRGQIYLASRTVMAMAVWSFLMALDDDDDQGGKRMLANGDLSREILIPTGEKDKYIRIPVGYGAPQMANNLATNLVQLMNNQISVGDAVANIITHNVKSVLPIAPSEISASKDPLAKLADTLTPSLFKSQMQWLMDRNAFGASIKPSSVQREKLLSQQSRQNTAEFWKDTAEMMYEQFGVDMHPEFYKHIFDSYRGMMGSLGDYVSASIENPNRALQGKSEVVPILNDYYGVKGENRIASLFYEYKGEAEKLAAEYKYYEEKGRLAEWKTPEKMQIVNWNNKVNDEMKKVTQARSKLKKDEGKMSEEMKASRLQNINTINDRLQREAVYAWRKREGLATANPR